MPNRTNHRNYRSWEQIKPELRLLDRKDLATRNRRGQLLRELKRGPDGEHGRWLDLIKEEFDWSHDMASKDMNLAELVEDFPAVQDLRGLTQGAFDELVKHEPREELDGIITELSPYADRDLSFATFERHMKVGIGKQRYGEHPEATLVALVELDDLGDICDDEAWRDRRTAELRRREPTSDEDADAILTEEGDRFLAEQAAQNARARRNARNRAARTARARAPSSSTSALSEEEDNDPPIEPPEVIWRRNLLFRVIGARNGASDREELWSRYPLDEEVISLVRQVGEAWIDLANYLEERAR